MVDPGVVRPAIGFTADPQNEVAVRVAVESHVRVGGAGGHTWNCRRSAARVGDDAVGHCRSSENIRLVRPGTKNGHGDDRPQKGADRTGWEAGWWQPGPEDAPASNLRRALPRVSLVWADQKPKALCAIQ